MMHKIVALFILVWIWLSGTTSEAAGRVPGEGVRVDLLTMGPGDALYTRFGHAAFRVRHPSGVDLIYNYGYTDFRDPHLVLSFLRGQVRFWLSVERYPSAMRHYQRDDRSVYQQTLNLSKSQQQEIARFLTWNASPANRYYLYHHFQDNCSTRVRDLLNDITQGAIRQRLQGKLTGYTYRQLVREGFAGRRDLLLLVELLLGRRLDRRVDNWDGTFLPHILRQELPQVTLADKVSLVSSPVTLYPRQKPSPLVHDPLAGVKLLWALAGLLVVLSILLWILVRRRSRWAGVVLALPVLLFGMGATLIWMVAGLSSLPELRWNELILILWPMDYWLLYISVQWSKGRFVSSRFLHFYTMSRLGVCGIVVLGQVLGVLYQQPRIWIGMVMIFQASLWRVSRLLLYKKDQQSISTSMNL